MTYGFLICAGNQKRFKDKNLKCLVKFGDKKLIDINIDNLGKLCDKVYVVCSNKTKHIFEKEGTYNLISIDSGKGSGDAVLKAINSIDNFNDDDTCVIQWGDTVLKESMYDYFNKYINEEENKNYKCIVPCIYEIEPYVRIIKHKDGARVLFRKYGDKINFGYHDLSIFYFNVNYVKEFLKEFYDKFYINDTYEHKHKEFEFLDIFNDTNIECKLLDTGFKSYSFNTVEEYYKVREEYLRND